MTCKLKLLGCRPLALLVLLVLFFPSLYTSIHDLLVILLGKAFFLFFRSSHQLRRFRTGHDLPLCPEVPPGFVGPILPDLRTPELEELKKMNPILKLGGHWMPETCEAMQRMAIIRAL
ncbi:hypothetical protein L596_024787 [Steinernema carpocapsae]|uniref:Galactosyltransferase N-terminal domain-containing protein n=1 Tax=Steinernema carpocapsae TaxID=34508 RepID=A0A4U5M5U6_STECR|nr:hypothetical protein L596_024787 [Steinernema carpocapsae]